jgi:hypothetical protein
MVLGALRGLSYQMNNHPQFYDASTNPFKSVTFEWSYSTLVERLILKAPIHPARKR